MIYNNFVPLFAQRTNIFIQADIFESNIVEKAGINMVRKTIKYKFNDDKINIYAIINIHISDRINSNFSNNFNFNILFIPINALLKKTILICYLFQPMYY